MRSAAENNRLLEDNMGAVNLFVQQHHLLKDFLGGFEDAVQECCYYLIPRLKWFDETRGSITTFIYMCLEDFLVRTIRWYYHSPCSPKYLILSNGMQRDPEDEEDFIETSARLSYEMDIESELLLEKIYSKSSKALRMYLKGYSGKEIQKAIGAEHLSRQALNQRLQKEAREVLERLHITKEDLYR